MLLFLPLSPLSITSNALKMYFESVIAYLMSSLVVSCLSTYSGFNDPTNDRIARKVSLFNCALLDLKGGFSSHKAR